MPTLEREALLERLALVAAAALAIVAAASHLAGLPLDTGLRFAGPVALAVAGIVVARKRPLRLAALTFAGLLPIVFPRHLPFADALTGGLVALTMLALARLLDAQMVAPSRSMQVVVAALGALLWVPALAIVAPFQGPTPWVPPTVVAAVLGACVGALQGAPLLPVFLRRRSDDVLGALRNLAAVRSDALRGLVHDLVEGRARVLRAVQGLAAEDAVREVAARSADAVALAGIRLVEKFAVADAVLAATPAESLEKSLVSLDSELAAATDASVQRDLGRARDVTREQLDQLRALAAARDRLVARLQAEVAALRRNETSIALLASADAAVAALQLEAIGTGLSRRAADLAAESLELHGALAHPPAMARA